MKTRRCVRVCLLLTVCLSTLACAGMFRNYGRFNPSDAVTQAFATFQVNKDFRYYITGPDLNPNALMGLHRSYRLDPSSLWREVQMTPEKMKEIVEGMNTKALHSARFSKGIRAFGQQRPADRRLVFARKGADVCAASRRMEPCGSTPPISKCTKRRPVRC